MAEAARLFWLPPATLQEDFKLGTAGVREEELPDTALRQGIPLGTQIFRGQERSVAIPTDDRDELCLPRVAISAMGSGKTKGFGANFGLEALPQGFTGITLDRLRMRWATKLRRRRRDWAFRRIT